MFKSIMPNLMVENVQETIQFYVEKLGFKVVVTVPENGHELNFALLTKDNNPISFQLKSNLMEEYPLLKTDQIKSSSTLFIQVDNIEEIYEDLREKVQVIKEIHFTFYHTKEFAIIDNNNYILTIAES